MMVYLIVFIALLVAELIYFRIADRFNIIDKPNLRSSHKSIVLRGGGIIFTISLLVYFFSHQLAYPWFMFGLIIITGISFADDVKHQSSLFTSCFTNGFNCVFIIPIVFNGIVLLSNLLLQLLLLFLLFFLLMPTILWMALTELQRVIPLPF